MQLGCILSSEEEARLRSAIQLACSLRDVCDSNCPCWDPSAPLCFYSQWHQDPWTTAEAIGFQLSIPDESGFEPASDAELFALLGDSQTRV